MTTSLNSSSSSSSSSSLSKTSATRLLSAGDAPLTSSDNNSFHSGNCNSSTKTRVCSGGNGSNSSLTAGRRGVGISGVNSDSCSSLNGKSDREKLNCVRLTPIIILQLKHIWFAYNCKEAYIKTSQLRATVNFANLLLLVIPWPNFFTVLEPLNPEIYILYVVQTGKYTPIDGLWGSSFLKCSVGMLGRRFESCTDQFPTGLEQNITSYVCDNKVGPWEDS